MQEKDYNTGIEMEITLLMISRVLLYRLMRSIGSLGLHNKVAFFEKLGPLRTLKIHSQYLHSKVLQFISPQIFLGITKASYSSITMNSIDLKL